MDAIPAVARPAPYHRGEYWSDAAVHVLGVVAAWSGGVWLILSRLEIGTADVLMALTIYTIAMAGMLTSSAAYNLINRYPLKEMLRRMDHAFIFVAIAGTYTPLLIRLPVWQAAASLALVWSIAGAGALLKLRAPRRYERVGLALYVGLGWIGLPMIPALSGRLQPDTGTWIAAGALIYTLGVGAYLAERVRYHNTVWHLAVLAAAACHFKAMVVEFAPV